jgi:hypothetical protein
VNNNTLTPEQYDFLTGVKAEGAAVCVAYNADEAIEAVKSYLTGKKNVLGDPELTKYIAAKYCKTKAGDTKVVKV